ncbi:zinc finger protein 526 [Salarias fasciatus]|uniref:Zinc finger protein 526-like n=1 Tax=Salarias fasciatus TaxID=181472 RepID=A0A672GT00_SALFA|nr:zinc finger protein 526-like [Salarias fasciatus]
MMASREQQLTAAEPTMSELDSLVVSFQTQLSDVMEAVLKSAMFQVSRLVEDVFLLEVKRRSQEVDSLRLRLQWTETKLSEEGGRTGKCVDCGREAVELSTETSQERSTDTQEDILRVSGVKTELDPEETWMLSCREEAGSDSPQEAEHPASSHMNDGESLPSESEDVLPVVDMKEEGLDKPSCSVLLGRWSGSLDDQSGPEMDKTPEMEEAQPRPPPESSDSLLRMKQDLQSRSAFDFSEEPQETASVESVEMTSSWAGLTGSACGAQKRTLSEAADSVQGGSDRDRIAPGSPTARLPHGEGSGVTVKEELLLDSDDCEENEGSVKEGKAAAAATFPLTVKQHRLSSETRRPMFHRASVQDVMKLHSRVGAGLRLQAALQHLHRPPKKHPLTLSGGSSAAPSAAHAVNPHGRLPSTSKAAPPPSVAAQRAQTSQLHRAAAPWLSLKAQHQSAHAAPHADSPAGPRHLLRCGQCGKCFPHPSNLKAHLQTHTGERPFCCSLCGRSFTKLSNLKAHRRVHTGERPYCCLACGKRFTQKCNLKRHQRIHLDV